MASGTRINIEENAKHQIYTYPLDTVLWIRDKLGLEEGFLDFKQFFKFAENVCDKANTLLDYQSAGLIQNKWKREPCKTPLNYDAIQKINQLYEGSPKYKSMLLRITYKPDNTTQKAYEGLAYDRRNDNIISILRKDCPCKHHRYYWDIELSARYFHVPAIIKLIPLREIESHPIFIEIQDVVPESRAYDGLDPDEVTRYTKIKGYGFRTKADIENSYYLTWIVGKPFYFKIKNLLMQEMKYQARQLKTNCVSLAKEIQGFDQREEPTLDV